MKNRVKLFINLATVISTTALILGRVSTAHACRWFFYQPCVPAGLKKNAEK